MSRTLAGPTVEGSPLQSGDLAAFSADIDRKIAASATCPPRFQFAGLDAAAADFARRFPQFDPDGSFAALRATEYRRLDDTDQVYLDYTGGGLHAVSQIDAHAETLRRRVLGNPHSNNPTSLATTELVQRVRRAVA